MIRKAFAVTLLRRLAWRLVFDGPRLPFGLAPWLFGFAIGSTRRRRQKVK